MTSFTNESFVRESLRYLESAEAIRSINANPYWPKWNSPWWHLSALFEMGLAGKIPSGIAEALLAEIQRTWLPYFFTKDAPAGRAQDQSAPCPCALGNIYQILNSAGLDVDKALPWARDWFVKYQMQDGGLSCDEHAYSADPNASSIVGTIASLEAMLSKVGELTPQEEQFLDLGAKFLLERELRLGSKSMHNAEERADEADWLKPCFPRFYLYDVLRGLAFVLKWADRRNHVITKESIAAVVRHLESITREGKILVARHSYAGVSTRMASTSFARMPRGEASCFPLLEEVSKIGEVSPYLTDQWNEALRLIDKLRIRGVLRWPMAVTEDYEVCYPRPLDLKVGDPIQLVDKGGPAKWRDWKWCKDLSGNEGWISETYFERVSGTDARIVKDYRAQELAVKNGETVALLFTDCGWSWCRKGDSDEGWLPTEILAEPR